MVKSWIGTNSRGYNGLLWNDVSGGPLGRHLLFRCLSSGYYFVSRRSVKWSEGWLGDCLCVAIIFGVNLFMGGTESSAGEMGAPLLRRALFRLDGLHRVLGRRHLLRC